MKKSYRIEVFSKPQFDDQHRIRVYQVNDDNSESWIMSGINTPKNTLKEVEYWFNRK